MAELRQYESLSEATDQQRSWFFRYLENGFHATEAARHAGYKDAGQSGWENKIRLEKLIAGEFKRKVMSADEALAGLADIARASLLDIAHIENDLVDVTLAAIVKNGKGHLVKEVGWGQFGLKVKLHDALKARDLILKVHGSYKDKSEDTDNGELEEILKVLSEVDDSMLDDEEA